MHDYHIHTHFCRHATGGLADYARQALRLGMREICFTPHIPMPGFRLGVGGSRVRMDQEDFPLYREELERTRALFPDLTILSGIEADYVEGREEELDGFLSAHDFDFVLMSIHFVARWPGSQWAYDISMDPRPLEAIYDEYLDAVCAGIRSGLFDCVAHMDLIKQKGRPLMATHRDRIEQIIGLCLAGGMSAEVNTSGARKDIAEHYPADEIVSLMRRRGLPLVVNSDAHDPRHVGAGFGAVKGIRPVRYRKRTIVAE
jgi:histidinol-phosphatase (PHP family)